MSTLKRGMTLKRDKTDALFSRYIKLLSGGYCKRCKKYLGVKSRGLHCAHCFSRGKKSVRFDRDNAQALCYGCHRYLDGHPSEKMEFFMEILGTKRFNALDKKAHTPTKIDIAKIEEELKANIRKLEMPHGEWSA